MNDLGFITDLTPNCILSTVTPKNNDMANKRRFQDGEYVQVGVLLTKEEMIQLKKNAHKNLMNVSEFVRSRTLK